MLVGVLSALLLVMEVQSEVQGLRLGSFRGRLCGLWGGQGFETLAMQAFRVLGSALGGALGDS